MAITIQPCNLAGTVIDRSSLTYYVKPGGLKSNVETTPHVKITNTNSATVTITLKYQIVDLYDNTHKSQQKQVGYNIQAGKSRVIALPVSFEMIVPWQGYIKGARAINADMYTAVEFSYVYNGATGFTENVTYHFSGSDFQKWIDQRGLPRFDETYTRLQRSNFINNQWVSSDEGDCVRIMVRHIRPAHFPWYSRVIIGAVEKVGNTETSKLASEVRDAVLPSTGNKYDSNSEYTSPGGFAPVYYLTGIIKVTLLLQWSYDENYPYWEKCDEMTLYMSFKSPLIEWNSSGDGIAIGKFWGGLSKTLEVAQDWEVDVLGNEYVGGNLTIAGTLGVNAVDNNVKQIILDICYPVGSYIWAVGQAALSALISYLPGSWTQPAANLEVPNSYGGTTEIYYAVRTA